MAEEKKGVVLGDGKYHFYLDQRGVLCCDRHGSKWREFLGDHAVHLLFEEANSSVPAPAKESRSHWDEDQEYSLEDWRIEVENDNSRLGYLEWVDHQREAAAHDHLAAGVPML